MLKNDFILFNYIRSHSRFIKWGFIYNIIECLNVFDLMSGLEQHFLLYQLSHAQVKNAYVFLILLQFVRRPPPVDRTVMVNAIMDVPVREESSIVHCMTLSAPSWTLVTAVAIRIMKDQPRMGAKLQLSKYLVLGLFIVQHSLKFSMRISWQCLGHSLRSQNAER